MTYISEIGFLGTRAFFYTDIVLVYMLMLPFLIFFSIWLAIKGKYTLHKITQILFFFITLGMLLLFYYEMYLLKIFNTLLVIGNSEATQPFYFLLFHLIVSFITFILWKSSILFASADKKRRALPGLYSRTHKIAGKRVFIGIFLISVSITILYWMLYVS